MIFFFFSAFIVYVNSTLSSSCLSCCLLQGNYPSIFCLSAAIKLIYFLNYLKISSNQIIKLNHQIKSSKNHLHHVLSVPILVRRRKNKTLFCARWKLNGFGHRSFSVQAPLVWNNLPPNIRHSSSLSQFKTSLKTFLFTSAFSELP